MELRAMIRLHRGIWGVAIVLTTGLCGHAADEASTRTVYLTVPVFGCLGKTEGTQPPPAREDNASRYDEIFFILAGKGPDDARILEKVPRDEHLLVDDKGHQRIFKNIPLWQGKLKDGEVATILINVRERDEGDSADSDLKEAEAIVSKITHTKAIESIARIGAKEILAGGEAMPGANDHVGSVAVRFRNVKGEVRMEMEPAEHARYLKGHPRNHPSRRAFLLDGCHSEYHLHLSAAAH
jgi:hypothetical protein